MLELTRSLDVWATWCDELGLDDVYWSAAHYRVWMDAWSCGFVGARWTAHDGAVLAGVLLEPLDLLPGGTEHFHAKTPYDFGGPRVVTGAPDLEAFTVAWCAALAAMGVVTEFNRVHPFHPAPPDATFHADNLVVDLAGGYDAVRAAFHGSWRRDLQKAERTGATFGCTSSPSDDAIATFSSLYDLTMDRVDAAPWYRFDHATFRALLALPAVSLATVTHERRVVAAALLLTSGETTFYHLSASRPTQRLWPNHLLLDGLIRTSLDRGARRLHLGAGAPALRRFKSRVANDAVAYHLVRRVLDERVLATITDAVGSSDAFPPFAQALSEARSTAALHTGGGST